MNRLYVSMLLLGLLAAGPASSALADRSGLSEKDQAAMMANVIGGGEPPRTGSPILQ